MTPDAHLPDAVLRDGSGPPAAGAGGERADPLPADGAAGAGTGTLSALVLSTVFPDPSQPTHGVFVLERVKELGKRAQVRVVAPVPWFRRFGKGVPGREVRDGIEVEHPPFWYVPRFLKLFDGPGLFLSTLPAALRMRRKPGFDVIDSHFAWPEGFAAILLGKLLRRPVTITLRGTLVYLASDPIRSRLMGWALRRADRVIAVSQELADRAIEQGAAAERVELVVNGVDAQRFAQRDRAEARRELGIPESGRLLVSVGNLSIRKGFHRVLRVLPRLLEKVPDLRFAIVGGAGPEGDRGPALRELARELGIADKVIFAGPQAPDQVATWLSAGDAFVLASDYEGCPNVVMEAMACARPVVVSRVGEVGRMVPGHAGIIYDDADDADALASALEECFSRSWDHAAIRSYAESQTWGKVAERVLEQWSLATGGSARGRAKTATKGSDR